MFKQRFSQLLTLFNVSTDLSFDITSHEIYGNILNTLGILFDVNTASIMLYEDNGLFRNKISFGQKEALILNFEADGTKGIFKRLLNERRPISARSKYEIAESGLPDDITSLHIFPLLKGESIIGLIILFNTDITEDDKR